jgi:rubrerythrin
VQDIRLDEEGNFRCWKCGGKNFDKKRTFRAKAAVGVGALLTHKKLKCLACGEYNDTGSAQPFTGTAREAGTDTFTGRMAASTAATNAKNTERKVERAEQADALKVKRAEKLAAIQAKTAARKARKGKLTVSCTKCGTSQATPDADRATCPNCGATGRRFVCTNCHGAVRVWGDDAKAWTFTCPKCETQQTHHIS